MSSSETETQALRQLTAQIVTAYVSSHDVAAETLPDLVRSVHGALAGAGTGFSGSASTATPAPARAPCTERTRSGRVSAATS
ncbi:hypothetical protein ASQ43_03365 [Parasaccharibacter apium]|nr:hypothetical protein ASQ43_03365 [Parasaccharibacter apium]